MISASHKWMAGTGLFAAFLSAPLAYGEKREHGEYACPDGATKIVLSQTKYSSYGNATYCVLTNSSCDVPRRAGISYSDYLAVITRWQQAQDRCGIHDKKLNEEGSSLKESIIIKLKTDEKRSMLRHETDIVLQETGRV